VETINMNDQLLETHLPKPNVAPEMVHRWVLWLVAALLLALYAPTLQWLWERWTLSVWHNGHGILITLVVAYLIREELMRLRELPVASNPWGFFILIPALMLHMLDTGIHSQLLSAGALVLSLPGFFLLFMGSQRTKAILFPLLMLFLTLPIPLVFTESIHLALRYIATDAVAWLLPYFGVPVFATGTLLETPAGSLQVADACSGFSILYATIAVAILMAYFCSDTRRRILILAIAVPLAIAVNIARVLILSLLVDWYGLDVLKTSAHEISGLATFVVALPIIFWLGREPQEKGERQ
jgi:exosortase